MGTNTYVVVEGSLSLRNLLLSWIPCGTNSALREQHTAAGGTRPCGRRVDPSLDGARRHGRQACDRALVERLPPRRQNPEQYAATVNAGIVDDHIGRFRELAEAGAHEVMVRFADLTDAAPIGRFAGVIKAFASRRDIQDRCARTAGREARRPTLDA